MGDAGAAFALGARIVLAATLTFAAASKLAIRGRLVDVVAPLVPRVMVRPVAVLLPLVELALAVALVAARGPAPGIATAVLLVVFTGVLVRAHVRRVPCPCFGAASERRAPGSADVVRNGVLLALAVLATGDVAGARAGGAVLAIAGLGLPTVAVVVLAARRG